jgi:Domain of unknown function (DUF4400)
MRLRAYLTVGLVVVLLEIGAGAGGAAPAEAVAALENEIHSARQLWGKAVIDVMVARTNTVYGKLHLESLSTSSTESGFGRVPIGSVNEGVLADGLRAATDRAGRIAVLFRISLYRALYRINLALLWFKATAAMLVAGLVDGWTVRALKPHRFGYTSPATYNMASHLAAWMGLLQLASGFSPFRVEPAFFPIWATLMIVPLRAGVANFRVLKGA